MIVTTETGSQYRINEVEKTWKRLSRTEESGSLRTEEGTYLHLMPNPVRPGEPMLLTMNPLTEDAAIRVIITSTVVAVV